MGLCCGFKEKLFIMNKMNVQSMGIQNQVIRKDMSHSGKGYLRFDTTKQRKSYISAFVNYFRGRVEYSYIGRAGNLFQKFQHYLKTFIALWLVKT